MRTFGAATTNRANYTTPSGLATGLDNTLVSCWVLPTTLTAGRSIWGSDIVQATRLAVDTTTSQVRLIIQRNTTNAEWTSPPVLTVGAMTFISVALVLGATGVGEVRLWAGTATTPPTEQTLAVAVAGAGAWSNFNTGFVVGNDPGNASAFQGDVGGIMVVNEAKALHSSYSQCGFNSGSIGSGQLQQHFDRFVAPSYRGDLPEVVRQYPPFLQNTVFGGGLMLAATLDDSLGMSIRSLASGLGSNTAVASFNGSSASANKVPYSWENRWPTPRFTPSRVVFNAASGKTRVGATAAAALRVGSSPVAKTYVGSTAAWP